MAAQSNGGGSSAVSDDEMVDEDLLRSASQVDNASSKRASPASTAATSASSSTSAPMAGNSSNGATPSDVDSAVHEQRFNKLKFLLQRSGVYSRIMGEKMEKERKVRAEAAQKLQLQREQHSEPKSASASSRPSKIDARKTRSGISAPMPEADATKKGSTTGKDSSRKRKNVTDDNYNVSTYLDEHDLEAVKQEPSHTDKIPKTETDERKKNGANAEQGRRNQPKLVTGATMREYQLDGLEWLVSLYENGLNGILADEMGLGKTLQTISFLAHLREKGVWGPFLVVAPLSTINNWVLELERFTPDMPAIMYHGDPNERKQLRERHLRNPTTKTAQEKFPIVVTSYELVIRDRKYLANHPWKFIVVDEGHRLKNLDCKLIRELKTYRSANRLILSGTPLHNNLAELWSLLNFILPDIFDDLATFEAWFDFSDIHDENASSSILSKENTSSVITQLHEILKPFLLRRLKMDVETSLPPKKEYLLHAPLTELQRELYNSVVKGEIRQWLLQRKTGMSWDEIRSILDDPDGSIATTAVGTAEHSRTSSPQPWAQASRKMRDLEEQQRQPDSSKDAARRRSGRPSRDASEAAASALTTANSTAPGSGASTPRKQIGRRAKRSVNYQGDDISDHAYFKQLETEHDASPIPLSTAQADHEGKLFAIKDAQRQIKSMHLDNIVMQARKICNHPFLFDWPADMNSGTLVVNEDLINASGKMLMLNQLLDKLFQPAKDGTRHKVLIFSQFTTMLDIIEEWAHEYKHWSTCRIDGTTPQLDRRNQMKSFNDSTKTGPDACNLFLLSTRAGGLGINLVAADTVIFFDSDWNPQMDLQAQDRVHRIGQTKPVLIFRLVSANTVEQNILKRAGNKRKLEALVIRKDKFKLPAQATKDARDARRGVRQDDEGDYDEEDDLKQLASQIKALESEQVYLVKSSTDQIFSDENLERLLDRSPAAYERQLGWVSADAAAAAADSSGAGSTMSHSKKSPRKSKGGKSAAAPPGGFFEVTETLQDSANEKIAKLMAA